MFHSLHMTKALTEETWDCRLWCRRLLVVPATMSSMVSFARQRHKKVLSSLIPACGRVGMTGNAALGSSRHWFGWLPLPTHCQSCKWAQRLSVVRTRGFWKISCSLLWVAKRQNATGGTTNPNVLPSASLASLFLSTLSMTQLSLQRINFSSSLTNHHRDFTSPSLSFFFFFPDSTTSFLSSFNSS